MNTLAIVGRIGKVRDLQYAPSGKAVVNFSVAVDNGKTADGNKRAATWFEITLWEKQAESLAPYLVVGDRIGITGQIRLQVDEGRDGSKYHKLVIDFPRVELMGEKGQTQTAAAGSAPAGNTAARPAARTAARTAPRATPAAAPEVSDEDIPF